MGSKLRWKDVSDSYKPIWFTIEQYINDLFQVYA